MNWGQSLFPYSFQQSHTLIEILEQAEELLENQQNVSIAGRLLAVRGKGKTSFCNIQAQHKRLQIYVRQDAIGESAFEMFNLCDIGDHLGVSGTFNADQNRRTYFTRKRNRITV